MNQGTFLAGALLAGFLLYIAAKGRLSTYGAVLFGPTAAPVPAGSTGKSGGGGLLGKIEGAAVSVGTKALLAGR